MPRKERDYSTIAVDPTYREVWEKAAKSPPFLIPIDGKAPATRLRYQLYETRKAMAAQTDPLTSLIHNMSIYISTSAPWVVTIDTTDLKIKSALAGVGIGAVQAPDFED